MMGDPVFGIQFVGVCLHHVDEVGEDVFLFDWYCFEVLHDGLQYKCLDNFIISHFSFNFALYFNACFICNEVKVIKRK